MDIKIKFSKNLKFVDCLNYFCIEYFERNGVVPCQKMLDEVESQILAICRSYSENRKYH
jgi:hypothetical protein